MWLLIFGLTLAVSIASIVVIIKKIKALGIINKLSHGKNRTAVFISILILMAVSGLIFFTMGTWNLMIIFIHFVIILTLFDIVGLFLRKVKKEHLFAAALVLTTVYLTAACINVNSVKETHYTLTSDDLRSGSLRIAGFADSHVGTTFSGEELGEYIDRINDIHADIVVISGDFVDDDTSYDDMLAACRQLGKVTSTYGVYYVFGNHDDGYYASSRGYTGSDVRENLEKNGVIVLEDDLINIKDNIFVLGRLDTQETERVSMEEFSKQYNAEDYIIVLDHEPNDYDNEAKYSADLVISGHTHGGQFFPINKAGEWLGMNDATYGHLKQGSTDFIVTSGISNWTFKFKTGCISEYIVVDVVSSAK